MSSTALCFLSQYKNWPQKETTKKIVGSKNILIVEVVTKIQ
jgi:hypothetical protein